MPSVWMERRKQYKEILILVLPVMLFLTSIVCFIWAGSYIGIEYARAWQRTLPVFLGVVCWVLGAMAIAWSVRVYYQRKARQLILGALMGLTEEYRVFVDLVLVHQGIRTHFPFLVVGPTGIIIVYYDSSPDWFIFNRDKKIIKYNGSKIQNSKLNYWLQFREGVIKRWSYDIGYNLEDGVHTYLVFPNSKEILGSIPDYVVNVKELPTKILNGDRVYNPGKIDNLVTVILSFSLNDYIKFESMSF